MVTQKVINRVGVLDEAKTSLKRGVTCHQGYLKPVAEGPISALEQNILSLGMSRWCNTSHSRRDPVVEEKKAKCSEKCNILRKKILIVTERIATICLLKSEMPKKLLIGTERIATICLSKSEKTKKHALCGFSREFILFRYENVNKKSTFEDLRRKTTSGFYKKENAISPVVQYC